MHASWVVALVDRQLVSRRHVDLQRVCTALCRFTHR